MSDQTGWGGGWDNQAVVLALAVIISSGVAGTGLFEYSGTPALGNGPIAWAVAPAVTADPYGNPLFVSGGFATEQPGGGLVAQVYDGALILTDSAAASPFESTGQVRIIHTAAATAEPILALNSPSADPAATITSLWLLGGPGSGTPEPQIVAFADNGAGSPSSLAGFFLFSALKFLSAITTSPYALDVAAVLQGSAGDLTVISSNDGNTYDTERHTETYENINISAVTPAFTSISNAWPVVVGPLYVMRARLIYQEAAAGRPRFQVTGPAVNASFTQTTGRWQQNNVSASFGGYSAVLGPVEGPVMSGVMQIFDLEAYAIFTAAGTVQLQGNTSAAADVWNVTGGTFEVFPVTV